ncbi:MAG: inositol monophosphatase family protein [Gammaproteobacteria bacterium]|nr:inositol monophosphatase family protein [Gammaproteobacteria bacterium]MCP5137725.1 inositol monophosphatase family protein [Gammaproteobacteria bacterium]
MIDSSMLQSLLRDAAQRELLPRFGHIAAATKTDGSLVTEADVAMQTRIQQALVAEWPEIGFLGEEMTPADHTRLLGELADGVHEGLWVLDPLDGTINFASGVPCFAVSLALLDREGVRCGLILDPVRDECFRADRGKGAFLDDTPLHAGCDARDLRDCVAEIDLKRLSERLRIALVRAQPFRSQRNFGSGALDWAWLAAGRFQLYLHGGQKLWDYAAGSLILAEAGGYAVTLQNDAVYTGSIAPRSVVGAGNPDLFALWRDWLRAADPDY